MELPKGDYTKQELNQIVKEWYLDGQEPTILMVGANEFDEIIDTQIDSYDWDAEKGMELKDKKEVLRCVYGWSRTILQDYIDNLNFETNKEYEVIVDDNFSCLDDLLLTRFKDFE